MQSLKERKNNASSALKAKTDAGRVESLLGHKFAHPELLERALTHSSHANEAAIAADNEQLEFLGDAVLGFVTSQELFERYPNFSEGRLSKTRAHVVSARHLIKVAKQLGLGEFLRLGKGEERSGGRQKSALLVDALEALIAALYLDGGIDAARSFVLKQVIRPELERVDTDPDVALTASDQKSALQEFVQAYWNQQPSYHVVQEEGPDHRKTFTVELRVRRANNGRELVQRAHGSTKKRAEQKAAQLALEILKQEAARART